MKNEIDLVLPWVDSSDLKWQKEKRKYDTVFNQDDRDNDTRFRDMNTLKYVLRSIEKNCVWFNKIYLLTAGHTPHWLDVSHPKIELVTHQELFIDKTALPTFSSRAIEMNLVNIKGLSKRFIYLNDDMIIYKRVGTDRFFKKGKPIDFFHHAWLPRNKFFKLLKGKNIWIDALNNNINLINDKLPISKMNTEQYYHNSYSFKNKISNFLYQIVYQKLFWINHWHQPQPYKRDTLEEVYQSYSKKMLETSFHKFRSNSDITQYLYRYWHLMKGDFEPHDHHDGFVAKISSLKYLERAIEKINKDKNINFVCFNDQMNNVSKDEFEQTSIVLENYLERIFPEKASFEY